MGRARPPVPYMETKRCMSGGLSAAAAVNRAHVSPMRYLSQSPDKLGSRTTAFYVCNVRQPMYREMKTRVELHSNFALRSIVIHRQIFNFQFRHQDRLFLLGFRGASTSIPNIIVCREAA